MAILLFMLALLAALFGFMSFTSVQSAIHETVTFLILLIAAVLFSAAAIVNAIDRIEKRLDKGDAKPPDPSEFA